MNEKGIAPLLVIFSIIIILSVAGSAYFLGKQSSTSKTPADNIATNLSEDNHITSSPTTISTPLPTLQPSVVNLPKADPVINPSPAVKTATSTKKPYTSTTYNYSLEYPNNWILSKNNDSEGVAQALIKPASGGSTSIYITVNSPYSSSGMVCANQPCWPSSNLPGIINGQPFNASVVKVDSENRFMFEIPNKKVSVQGYSEPVSLNVYASYNNDSEKTDILSIISSLKY